MSIREVAAKRLARLRAQTKEAEAVKPLNVVSESPMARRAGAMPPKKKTLLEALSPSAQAIKDRQEAESLPEGGVRRRNR